MKVTWYAVKVRCEGDAVRCEGDAASDLQGHVNCQ